MSGWMVAAVCVLIAAVGFGFAAWMIRDPKPQYKRRSC